MKAWKYQFIEFILNKRILNFGEFILKSNRKSPYFFNSGLFSNGRELSMLGRFYAQALVESNIDYKLLFGLAYKGIPIVTATAIALADYHNYNVSYCFNRKELKDHGEGGLLVGSQLQGKVILVDDVITAGTAIRETVNIINSYNATLVGVLIALDRQEQGSNGIPVIEEIEHNYNCKVISIITLSEIVCFLEKKPEMKNYLVMIQEYCKKYCTVTQ